MSSQKHVKAGIKAVRAIAVCDVARRFSTCVTDMILLTHEFKSLGIEVVLHQVLCLRATLTLAENLGS